MQKVLFHTLPIKSQKNNNLIPSISKLSNLIRFKKFIPFTEGCQKSDEIYVHFIYIKYSNIIIDYRIKIKTFQE